MSRRRFSVEHLFFYGWDDAGWSTDGKPETFRTRKAAQAAIDDLCANGNGWLDDVGEYRIVPATAGTPAPIGS